MTKVLVTGATGLLGCSLVPYLQERGHQVTSMGNTHSSDFNVDLTNYDQTVRSLNEVQPSVIINLVALTNVDRCETYQHEAYLLNVKTVDNICAWINEQSHVCHLVQISTDQVYDGFGPHTEEELKICNFYAMSKLAGEFIAKKVPSTILRTNFIGPSQCDSRSSLTDWLYGALLDQALVNVFEDVMFSPLSIGTLCGCIESCIVEKPLGVFNLGSRDGMSKADFAFAFASALGFQAINLKRVKASSNSSLVARRPNDMRMNCGRFEAFMGTRLPSLIDEISRMAGDYPCQN